MNGWGVLGTRTVGAVVAIMVLVAAGCGDAAGPSETPETVSSVEVDPVEFELKVSDTVRLVAVARTASGTPMAARRFTWLSDRSDIAGVDSAGLVTGHGVGRANIRVSTGGKAASAVVRVIQSPAPPAQPSLTSIEPTSIQAGWDDFTLVVRGAGFLASSQVLWDEQFLETVAVDGTEARARVTAALVALPDTISLSVLSSGPGSARSNTLPFVVHPRPVHSVRLKVAGNAVFEGNRLVLEAEALDQFGVVLVGRVFQWTSVDTTVARIENGYLLGERAGSTILTATAGGKSANMVVHVAVAPADALVFDTEAGTRPELLVRTLGRGPSIIRLLPTGTYGSQAKADASGQRIAFVGRSDGSNLDIWTMNRDGSDLRRLTTDGGIDDQPTWSPDGRSIAFRSTRSGKSDIWVIPAAGGAAVNLTASSAHVPEEVNDRPAWSPRGDVIAFSRGFGLGQSLYTVRPDGSDLREFASRPGSDLLEPAFSPDGAVLAFRSRNRLTAADRIEFLSALDREPLHYAAEVPVGARNPSWLDGGWLAVSAPVLPGSSTETIALVHLLSGRLVVPLTQQNGVAREPSGIRR